MTAVAPPPAPTPAPDRRRPGERHEVDARVGPEQTGDVVGRRGDHIDDTRRDVGLLDNETAQPGRVPRGVRVGFEDDGVARGQRRTQLVEDDFDREVGRRHRGHHTGGFLDDGADVAVAEQATALEDALPAEFVDEPRREAQ